MKKGAVATVLLLLLLIPAGCGGPRPAAFAPQKYFTAGFTLFHGDYAVEGRIVCNAYEDITLTFTDPPALACVTVRASSAGFVCDVGGVTDEIALPELPDTAPLRLVTEAVRESVFPTREFTAEGGDHLTTPVCGGLPVTCRFSAEGRLTEITCEAADVAARFTEPT